MLTRLLIVVLAMAGPIPVHVCGAARSAPLVHPAFAPCHCDGHAHHHEDADSGDEADHAAPGAHARHADCATTLVHSTGDSVTPAGAGGTSVELPAAPVAFEFADTSPPAARTPPAPPSRPPPRPLFITLLTLRN